VRTKSFLLAALLAVSFATAVSAQNISSTVKGTVHDTSGGVIPNAQCTLTNQATSFHATINTSADGSFVFLDVLAGSYELAIKAAGFKVLRMQDIVVTSSEFHALNDIILSVGETTESVTVAETAPPVQTVSGERSDLVGATALSEIAVKGRDFLSYMQTLPGVIDTSYQSRDASGRNEMGGIHMNGARDTQALMLIDGTPVMDSGNNNIPEESTMDSIEEVKILTNAYQAEYGRNAGGMVSVITKSGSDKFHGSAYEYYRNEELNANTFFNNTTGTPRGPYRYRITGYTLGGPLLIPKATALRHKLYFFFGHEMLGSKVLFSPEYVTMPTALERAGDFSQSYNNAGALIAIKDPTTGIAYPGNKIPQSQFSALGLNMLNFYPLPNFSDPRPGYKYSDNYQATYSGSWPRTQEVGRLDYNLSAKTQLYFRVMNDASLENSGWGNWVNGSVNYDLTPVAWNRPAHMYGGHLTQTFSATLVDEFMVQKTYNSVIINPIDASAVQRSKMGNPPQLFVNNVPSENWIPSVSFGGTPSNTVNSSLSNSLPEALPCDAIIVTNNLSKVWGKHQLKVGIYGERNRKIQPAAAAFRGSFSFAVDSNNPYNAGDGFANALLGDFDTYTEAQFNPLGNYFFWNVEWFAQDNWRVTSKLTLDFGLRFTHMPPTIDRNHNVAAMDTSLYSIANAPLLYRPALNGSNQRVAQNPLTGAFAPASYIGLFVPGAGNSADGSFVAGVNGNPPGLITTNYLEYGPRFGFAYDVFGDGKTAVRGGFGMFTDRVQGNEIYNTSGNPPVNYTPVQYYGNLSNYAQSAGVIGPSSLTEWFGHQKMPEVMNFNLGVQQQVGAWVADISYVGMLSRHLLETYNLNPIPLYAHFNPANRDTTTASSPLPDNFLRPYLGYSTITDEMFGASTNFNSLQAAIRRRLTKGLQVSASYTFSKALGVAGADGDGLSSYLPARERNYGPLAFNRTQSFVFSYVYELPQAGTKLGVRPAKWVLDNWELSGVTTFQTGAPVTPGFNTQPSTDISGSSDSARINVVGNPNLSTSQRTFYQEFNTAAFALPAVGTLGNGGTNFLYGPGVNNWDLSVTKQFPVFSESRRLSFRGEFYNAFNHTQFSGWNTTATFSPTGQLLSNTPFGQANAARLPRYVELSARFVF